MRVATAGLVALLWIASAAALARAASEPGPRAVVEDMVTQVLAVLRDVQLSQPQRHRRIEDIAYGVFDFPTMSRLVLARNWKRFSEAQRAEFESQFKKMLANNYRSRFDEYDDEEVELLGERQEPRGDLTVRTRILGGGYEGVNIDYRLRDREGRWRVIDVLIEGISLVSNYRDQFKAVLSQGGGPEDLIQRMREKNAGKAPADEG